MKLTHRQLSEEELDLLDRYCNDSTILLRHLPVVGFVREGNFTICSLSTSIGQFLGVTKRMPLDQDLPHAAERKAFTRALINYLANRAEDGLVTCKEVNGTKRFIATTVPYKASPFTVGSGDSFSIPYKIRFA